MSNALSVRGVLRVVVDGMDLAVWRGDDGKTRAWENRCPHRGMRLSYGFVRGNRLTCLYHGWGYDGDGACVSIPAHPTLTPPKTIKVARYACVEAAGLVWVAAEGANDPLRAPDGRWLPAQTIDLDLTLADARAAVAAAAVEAQAADSAYAGSGIETSDDSPLVTFVDARSGSRVLCALQAVADDRTALHVLVDASAGDVKAMQRAYAEWGRRIRRNQGRASLPAFVPPAGTVAPTSYLA
ncbi:oxidoreductase [Methylobacterium oryzae]|uniref:Oxidoreductase n=2 Tax=Methylobacterium oryzae TaxID=334852 RepID=A0ABU7TVD9_9HYPH